MLIKQLATGVLVLALIVFSLLVLDSSIVVITEYIIESAKIPLAFDGFKIVQISDFHDRKISEYDDMSIAEQIANVEPDIIVITGDLIDERTKNLDNIYAVFSELDAYPIYYENGNHDIRSPMYLDWLTMMDELGIVDVSGSKVTLTRGDDTISLIGIEQTYVDDVWGLDNEENAISGHIEPLLSESDQFRLLLSHHPNFYQEASDLGIDMMLSGHFHGGHIQIFGWTPLNWFDPYYKGGSFDIEGMSLIVSKGVGDGFIPIRIGCDAEIVAITLNHSS